MAMDLCYLINMLNFKQYIGNQIFNNNCKQCSLNGLKTAIK